MPRSVASLAVLASLLLAPAARAQAVHVLHGGFDGDALQNVVNAAASGDTILVKGEGAFSMTIDGKSLTVVNDVGSASQLRLVSIRNVPAGGRVVVRGFTISALIGFGALVTLENNAGSVWIEESLVRVRRFGATVDSVHAKSCASVVIRTSQLDSDTTGMPTSGTGLRIESSSVALFDVGAFGGHGVTLGSNGFSGGPGVDLVSGSLFASGSILVGGNGGAGTTGFGGAAGHGIVVGGSADLRDGFQAAGSPGTGALGLGAPGQPSVVLAGGSLTTSPGPARHLDISSPVRELQNATYVASGLPNETVGILYSLAPLTGPPQPFFESALAIDLATAGAFALGTIPASGTLSVSLPVPALPPPFQGVTFFDQSFFFDVPLTYVVLGPASTVVIVDDTL